MSSIKKDPLRAVDRVRSAARWNSWRAARVHQPRRLHERAHCSRSAMAARIRKRRNSSGGPWATRSRSG